MTKIPTHRERTRLAHFCCTSAAEESMGKGISNNIISVRIKKLQLILEKKIGNIFNVAV